MKKKRAEIRKNQTRSELIKESNRWRKRCITHKMRIQLLLKENIKLRKKLML